MNLFKRSKKLERSLHTATKDELDRQLTVLYNMFIGIIGPERVIVRGDKYEAESFIHSTDPKQRLIGMQRLVYESTDFETVPTDEEIPKIMEGLEDELANLLARQAVEDRLERLINDRLDERHQEYVRDLKMQLIQEELEDAETPQTKEKLDSLNALNDISLTKSVMTLVRPKAISEIVGQEEAVGAMISKLATPYPQHMILYGPPGVGKTTAARLVLEEARKRGYTPFGEKAPFVETSGTTLRWDVRGITDPLIGSVHDPIYQGARRDLAETGIPEPKPGLVTDAHGGVLFIDEIGEMDPLLLNKLLKVLEDKRVQFESSYYDSSNPLVPTYIRKLFSEGAPADFILIGATTRDPSEISPAIRSRCSEVFFSPLESSQIEQIVAQAAQSLGVELEDGVGELISEYTTEGRKAVTILSDAYGTLFGDSQDKVTTKIITKESIYKVGQVSRFSPASDSVVGKIPMIGHVNGLGVSGYMGSIIEIEAVAFPAKEAGKGYIRFNDTAGSMAKDSVFNAAAVVRKVTGKVLNDYDVHVNVVGGGNIDGPSAGCAIVTAIVSAIEQRPVRQDATLTGEISVQGFVKPVGGVYEKAYGAKQAKAKYIVVPEQNSKDIPVNHLGLDIVTVSTIEEVLNFMFV